MREMLGDETPAFLRALDEPPALALRVNPLRPGADAAAQTFLHEPVPWVARGYYIDRSERPGASLAHRLGAFYLQEASAMASAAALDAQPGEKILDLCAAPGGKTSQIAFAMRGHGLLVSNEPVPSRAKILAENLERLGIVNAIAVSAYPDRLAARWPAFFDAVLVDAPCSGEGMFRREPASRSEWNPSSPAGCARRQADILDSAAEMLRPGGRMVYSTCTFNRFENERTVEAFLERHPDFVPADFELPGVGKSKNGCLRLWPHKLRGDGHFVARLVRLGTCEPPRAQKPRRKTEKNVRAPRTVSEETPEMLLKRLEDEVCALPEALRGAPLIRQGDYVHALPFDAPPLDGIKTYKPGLCLMRVGRSHVQPMPALAMSVRPDFAAPLPDYASATGVAHRSFDLDDAEAEAFLLGAAPETPLAPGRALLTWRSLPLGWIKVKR